VDRKKSINQIRAEAGLQPYPGGPGDPAYDKSVQPKWYERIFGFILLIFGRP
jgi:hypothetical protein